MADFCVDNTQQVEFDEKVVCGLWQCEALRASQKKHRKVMAPIKLTSHWSGNSALVYNSSNT